MNYPEPYSNQQAKYPTCVDLFCGAGGLTLGFCQAGGIPVSAVDHDKDSIVTYRNMFPMVQEACCGNIEDWNPSFIIDEVDVVIGGPPCQGFSLARGLRFVDDPRNYLYKHFIRLVSEFSPKWIVMENVPGITNIGKGIILKQIYEDFQVLGYWLDHRVINMADYGVPQKRMRTIFVGSRIKSSFTWPKPTHSPEKNNLTNLNPYTSVKQALGDLPWPMGNYFSHRANSQMRGPRNRNTDTEPAFTLRVRGDEFALCEELATGAFIPGPLPEIEFFYRNVDNHYQEMMRELPPEWISNYQRPPVKDLPYQPLRGTRRIAIREQARLQSFPDWFSFSGKPYSQSRQIGNAVPPLFAKQLFNMIFNSLEDTKRLDTESSHAPKLFSESVQLNLL